MLSFVRFPPFCVLFLGNLLNKSSVLALDLATTTGYAFGRVGERCQHGSIRFCKRTTCSRAEIFKECICWYESFLAQNKPDIIVFESPILPINGLTTYPTVRLLHGLAGIIEGQTYKNKIFRLTDINVQSIRAGLLGFKPKRAEAKQEVIKCVRAFGYSPEDDNAADAIALFLYFSKNYSAGAYDE